MCTAISLKTKDHYFGRNLDLEYSYKECITITPRKYNFHFRNNSIMKNHHAIIGTATVHQNYPLYYDATNECGLSMAGLNFPGNAVYFPQKIGCENIAPFELIPWILCQCKTVEEAKTLIHKLNLVCIPFNNELPLTPLHWILTDQNQSITIEPMETGLIIYNNPVGILTNNPPFDYHITNLNNYLNLTSDEPTNRFSSKVNLDDYSRGMGAIGLPGDLSSPSRFIRAAFTKLNSVCKNDEQSSVSQFFHILDSVSQTEGCVKVGNVYEKTLYSSCCNTNQCIYYYKTYANNQITAVHLFHEDITGKELIKYPFRNKQYVLWEN